MGSSEQDRISQIVASKRSRRTAFYDGNLTLVSGHPQYSTISGSGCFRSSSVAGIIAVSSEIDAVL
jgi:hydroxyethylthiazole kinase-like sugar kinase family protein